MSTTYKISQLRDLCNDWETGLDQAVALLPLFPIEVIDEYWSMAWMQNPANPDDRWKSDWIRAILMAFSPEGSLPYEAKKQDRIRHKKERSYYDSTDKFGLLTLTSDWSHLSSQLLHDIIKNLGVTQLDFKCAELFENYLKNPVEVTEIKFNLVGSFTGIRSTCSGCHLPFIKERKVSGVPLKTFRSRRALGTPYFLPIPQDEYCQICH